MHLSAEARLWCGAGLGSCACAHVAASRAEQPAELMLMPFTRKGAAWAARQGRASAAKGAVVADDGAGVPVEAAAVLVPGAVRVLARGAAVVQHAVAQHLQPAALQLRHAPAQKGTFPYHRPVNCSHRLQSQQQEALSLGLCPDFTASMIHHRSIGTPTSERVVCVRTQPVDCHSSLPYSGCQE